MKHHQKIKKLGRNKDQRTALFRTQSLSLIKHGRIKTTLAKAKSLRPDLEKLVTLAKKNSLASRKLVASRLGNDEAAKKLCEEIANKYKDRPGGYLRIIKMPNRVSDAAPLALIEFV
ncbi:MAG TPA: 50S ribosomal protein L17 [Candidatus Vogelbacteria bacterium]|nr:50S ribosomal protein L17 [Candidatus Vogelbacteria bacterium]